MAAAVTLGHDRSVPTLFSSNRHFFVVSYQASHGLLLLRSAKGRDGAKTRIDILFRDVRALELRVWTQGFTVREVDADFLASAASKPAALAEPGNQFYAVTGEGWNGFIIGGLMTSMEDEGEVDAPSPLMKSKWEDAHDTA